MGSSHAALAPVSPIAQPAAHVSPIDHVPPLHAKSRSPVALAPSTTQRSADAGAAM
jgi:hypothetical protein